MPAEGFLARPTDTRSGHDVAATPYLHWLWSLCGHSLKIDALCTEVVWLPAGCSS